MSLLPYAPLAEAGPEDSAALKSFIDVVGKVNVVNARVGTVNGDESTGYVLKDYVERYVWDVIVRAKQRRLPLEMEWMAIQRMTVLQHDEGQKYKGRSNAYLPVYARNRKTLTTQLSKGLFPSDEFMDVEDIEGGESEDALAAKAVVKYELENSGLRRTIKAFLGQYVDFGVSCIKGFFRTEQVLKGRRPVATAPGALPDMGLDMEYDQGFQASTRSMFNVVVYPETAESKRELRLEAERLEVPMDYVQAMHDEKRWENVQEALSVGDGSNDEFDWVNTATLADVADIPNTMELRGIDGSPVESCIVVECWTRVRLPKSQYAPFEDSRRAVPVRIVFVNGVAVQVRRNPFYHQESPFQYARDNDVVGSFYAQGAGRMNMDTQYLANDFVNQMNDVGIYGLNPIALVNTNYFSGDMGTLRPGRTYKVRDVEKAIKFHSPDVNNLQYGQTMVDKMIAYGQDAAGSPPVLQGNKSSNTATGTQILQHNAQSPLQDAVEDIEADVMVPLMCMAWELSKQYRTQPFIRVISGNLRPVLGPDGQPMMGPDGLPAMGPDVVSFLPSDINARLRFKFLSSSQAVNRQARQQGVMLFADLATRLGQNLQMQGLMLNPKPILQKVWNDGLGFRGFDKVIVPMPMAPPMAGPLPGSPGTPPPGAGGSPPAGPPGPPASTVPQGNVPGAPGNEPVPGEGTDANDIMGQAQQGNAMTGQFNQPAPGMLPTDDVIPY